MKKSEMTVSMPMTTYDELMFQLKRYEELIVRLKSCFGTQSFDAGTSASIDFDISSAMKIIKELLPLKYQGVYVNCLTFS